MHDMRKVEEMSALAAFLIGLIVGALLISNLSYKTVDKKIKSGHIHDSDYNWYRVEKETR